MSVDHKTVHNLLKAEEVKRALSFGEISPSEAAPSVAGDALPDGIPSNSTAPSTDRRNLLNVEEVKRIALPDAIASGGGAPSAETIVSADGAPHHVKDSHLMQVAALPATTRRHDDTTTNSQ